MRLPQTVVEGTLCLDQELVSLDSDQGVSSSDANGKSPGRKRPRRRHDRSASPSSRQYTTDSTSVEVMLAGGDKEDNAVSAHADLIEPATSSSKGWHIAGRAERFVAHLTSSVGSRRPPRVPSPMTSPTTTGRGGSSSSSHGAADDSGMSSAGGGSSSGRSRSSRRPNGRSSSSSRLSSRPSSSCSSSGNGLNASVSESSLTTMRAGESSTLCGTSLSPLTIVDWSTVDKTMTGLPGVVGIVNHTNTCFINAVVQCLGHTAPLVAEFLSRFSADRKRSAFHIGNRSVVIRASSPMLLTDSGGEEVLSVDGSSQRGNPDSHVKDSDVIGTGRILGRRCRSQSHADKLSRYGAMSGTTRVVSVRDSSSSSNGDLNCRREDQVTTRTLTNLVNGLWTGHYSTSVSYAFCETVRHLAPDLYNITEQHDAHEFFVWLLDRLNDDQKVGPCTEQFSTVSM